MLYFSNREIIVWIFSIVVINTISSISFLALSIEPNAYFFSLAPIQGLIVTGSDIVALPIYSILILRLPIYRL
jgi:hypothetical protein